MAQNNRVIGFIACESGEDLQRASAQALSGRRSSGPSWLNAERTDLGPTRYERTARRFGVEGPDQVISADLVQLKADLNAELRSLLERLLRPPANPDTSEAP